MIKNAGSTIRFKYKVIECEFYMYYHWIDGNLLRSSGFYSRIKIIELEKNRKRKRTEPKTFLAE